MLAASCCCWSARGRIQTANRLDRLHVRYDLSWQALDGALARRAVVARAVAVDAYGGGPDGKRLAALADAAERAPRAAREAAENELSAALALVDPASLPVALVAELADAEARVLLARRFHNDAVRDTLALRERPAVRLLRLGGTAALPTYFEIAERAEASPTVGVVSRRTSARVVLLDEDGCVLLFCGSDPANDGRRSAAVVVHRRRRGPAGGDAGRGRGARTGRGDRAAGRPGRHGRTGVAARRGHRLQRVGDPQRGDVLRAPHPAVRAVDGRAAPALERRYIHGHRWCDATMIGELVAKGETVYPLQLGELLAGGERAGRRTGCGGRGGSCSRSAERAPMLRIQWICRHL